MDPNQILLACACCGVATPQGLDNTKCTLNRYRTMKLSALNILQLSDEARNEYYSTPQMYRKVFSVTPEDMSVVDTTMPLWHLHSQFVMKPEDVEGNKTEMDEFLAVLCDTCYHCLSGHTPKLPKFSLSNGYDFGDITRLGTH